MNMETVLVTGANGFLGREILFELAGESVNVHATDMGDACSDSGIVYEKADITQPENLIGAIGNPDVVVHAAGLAHIFSPNALSNERFRRINEIGTENVAKASVQVGVRHLILISSVSVYGPYTLGQYDENTPCRPTGPYAISKYAGELRAIEVARRSDMALTILRLATLYGEQDPGNIKRLIQSIDKWPFLWIGDGRNRKSLLYKGDAARACKMVALSPAKGIRVFNVSGPPCTMREIVYTLSEYLGKRPLPGRVPAHLALGLSSSFSRLPIKKLKRVHPTVKKWLAEDVYDTRRFERVFGFTPDVDIEEGLRREVVWYRANN